MWPDHTSLVERISAETGLAFEGASGRDADGNRWLEVYPAGHPAGRTFSIRTIIGWRRVDVCFTPGNFAGELMRAMGAADETGRLGFRAILGVCREAGAEVVLTVNGVETSPDDPAIWSINWRRLGLVVRRGMLAINTGDRLEDDRLIAFWTSRVAAAMLSLLPLEAIDQGDEDAGEDIAGLPEGASKRVEVNRYERDRRNRAAALAIHGCVCAACGLDMSLRYGPIAAGLIEVHHVTPISELGPGYAIDVRRDLVPLCPNCHSVAHRRIPPYKVEEVRAMYDAFGGAHGQKAM